jgi:predicted transposase YbfD/YdcC
MGQLTKAERKTFLELLGEVKDHRKGNAVRYRLQDILFVGIVSILCGAETYTGMESFCEVHFEELGKYVTLKSVPSHDVFGDIFSRVDVAGVGKCFELFTDTLQESLILRDELVVALDGKTVRRSGSKQHRAAHIETAYLSDLQIVLGQVATEEKSNEITAIPMLLDMLALPQCTVTIDAIGTQKSIAETIIKKQANYILSVKENQPTLMEDLRLYAQSDLLPLPVSHPEAEGRYACIQEKGHGRMEKRACWLYDDITWLRDRNPWPGLRGAAVIRSTRTNLSTGEFSESMRYFIYSHPEMTAEGFLRMQRKHWRIENNLHWTLDCVFHEDDIHIRMGHAAQVLNIIRKLCMQMLKMDTSWKGSLAAKRQRCAWSFDYAQSVLKNWMKIGDVS